MNGQAARSLAAAPAREPSPAGAPRTVDRARLLLPVPPDDLVLPVLPGALCRDQDPDLWFPGPGRLVLEGAIAVCRACPVRAECLDWAVQADERDGIWGGTTPGERALIRRARKQGRARS